MLNQVFFCNTNKFPAIAKDYSDVKARAEKITNEQKDKSVAAKIVYASEAIPTCRRSASLSDKWNNGNYAAILGSLGLIFVNWKEDMRDMHAALRQIYSKINKDYSYDPLYNRGDYQHEFSFTRGIVGEKKLYDTATKGNPFSNAILNMDVTFDKTMLGRYISKKFKIVEADKVKVNKIRSYTGKCAMAYRFASPVLGGKTIARAMTRTTLAGVAVMGALEIPAIIYATTKGNNPFEHIENGAKQTLKSTTSVVAATVGIGIGGAIGAKRMGATGSLIGMGVGAILGSQASKKVQQAIG